MVKILVTTFTFILFIEVHSIHSTSSQDLSSFSRLPKTEISCTLVCIRSDLME